MIFVDALRYISWVIGIIVCCLGGILFCLSLAWCMVCKIYDRFTTIKFFVEYARNRKSFLKWKAQQDASGGAK
jgi:hypothetical protein